MGSCGNSVIIRPENGGWCRKERHSSSKEPGGSRGRSRNTGAYCHTRVLQLGYMLPKHGSQKPLNEPFVRLLHSAELQMEAFTGFQGPQSSQFQVNLTGYLWQWTCSSHRNELSPNIITLRGFNCAIFVFFKWNYEQFFIESLFFQGLANWSWQMSLILKQFCWVGGNVSIMNKKRVVMGIHAIYIGESQHHYYPPYPD